MNVDLLREIAEVIMSKPNHFNMNSWHCDTQHCIGGWAQVLSNAPQTKDPEAMANLLGIEFVRETDRDIVDEGDIHAAEGCQAGRLFYQENWPEEFIVCGDDDCPDHPYRSDAEAAAHRIDHFIATKGRE